ncbi:MAG: hypothetical protein ACP5MI_10525 [Candidatus Kryptoniota bacterium]
MRKVIWALLFTIGIEFSGCNNNTVGPGTPSTPIFIGMDGKLVTKLVCQEPYLYAGAAANGLWRCDLDKMTDWEYLGLADTSLGNWANVGVLDIDIQGNDILVSYNNAIAGVDLRNTVGIWRSIDGGKNWFRSDAGIPETIDFNYEGNVISTCRRSPHKPEIAIARYAIATYRSIDGGYHWELISGRRRIIGGDDHMRWNPFRPGEYWAWGTSSVFQPYLVCFEAYGDNLKLSVDFIRQLGFPSDQIVGDVAFDAGDPNIIHVATTQGLMTSTDGGYSWVVGRATIPDSGYVRFAVEHDYKPGVFFLCGYTSVYYSVDHGETMHVLSHVPYIVESMAIDERGKRIFVGTAKGVYAVSFPPDVN